MKRIIPYCVSSIIATVVAVSLSIMLGFSLSNTWQASVAMLFIFGPLWVCGWRETTAIKNKHPLVFVLGRFCLINLVIGYILSVVLFFAGMIK